MSLPPLLILKRQQGCEGQWQNDELLHRDMAARLLAIDAAIAARQEA